MGACLAWCARSNYHEEVDRFLTLRGATCCNTNDAHRSLREVLPVTMFQRCARYGAPSAGRHGLPRRDGYLCRPSTIEHGFAAMWSFASVVFHQWTVVNQRHGQAICLSTMEPCSVEGPLPNIRMRSSGFIGFARVCSASGKRARAGRWTTSSVAPTARVPENPCSGH